MLPHPGEGQGWSQDSRVSILSDSQHSVALELAGMTVPQEIAGKFSSGRIPPGPRGGDSLDENVSLHPRRLVPVRVSDSATAWGSQGDDSATLPARLPGLPPLRNARE